MAIGVLVLGESGTGKTHSIKNFSPDEVKILSVKKTILPFRGKYEVVITPTGKDIERELKNTKKKNIVIDDFQYILGVPMMKRIGEKGWDKFNEIQQPYMDALDALSDLPSDTIVYLTSHVERDDNGRTKIKTIGKALDKYVTIEGLFMIVLGTLVIDSKYYFVTQNNGSNTLKSPEGMFPSVMIPNDLKYVEEKIRNYYYMDGAMNDTEMAAVDEKNKVEGITVPDSTGRRTRSRTKTSTVTPPTAETDIKPTREQVQAENKEKMERYIDQKGKAAEEIAGDADGVPFDEAEAAAEAKGIKEPELQKPPRRTRRERTVRTIGAEVAEEDMYFYHPESDSYWMIKSGEEIKGCAEVIDLSKQITKEEYEAGATKQAKRMADSHYLTEDTYFFIPATSNYVMKHAGDKAPDGGQVITREEFGEGIKRIAQENNPVAGAMNSPEGSATRTRRTRRTRA